MLLFKLYNLSEPSCKQTLKLENESSSQGAAINHVLYTSGPRAVIASAGAGNGITRGLSLTYQPTMFSGIEQGI